MGVVIEICVKYLGVRNGIYITDIRVRVCIHMLRNVLLHAPSAVWYYALGRCISLARLVDA
jgi:hypothetical protein